MPNRIIKETICTSDDINGLSWIEEVFFYRLIVSCDDYGRMDARPAILKARLFPLKDITVKQVENALSKLVSVGMVRVYEYDRQPYLLLEKWAKHQRIRDSKEKFPEPPKNSICGESRRVAASCGELRPESQSQSESQSESQSNTPALREAAGALESLFEKFWEAYPRKEAKLAARKAFEKLKPDEALLAEMIPWLEKACQSEQWQDKSKIPHPATWLNQKRWEGDPPPMPRTQADRRPDPLAWLKNQIAEGRAEEARSAISSSGGST